MENDRPEAEFASATVDAVAKLLQTDKVKVCFDPPCCVIFSLLCSVSMYFCLFK
jgi:hypothetical protein